MLSKEARTDERRAATTIDLKGMVRIGSASDGESFYASKIDGFRPFVAPRAARVWARAITRHT